MLRTTRTVTYTPPPSRAEERALEEIAAIDEKGAAATPEELQRRNDLAATLQPVTLTRFTVSTISAYQYGRYEANRRAVGAWMERELGKPSRELMETSEGQQLFLLGLRWARVWAALAAVETCTASRLDDDDTPWMEIKPPDGWDTPDGYLKDVPTELAGALAGAAEAVNPGLFVAAVDEEAKKKGGIGVD